MPTCPNICAKIECMQRPTIRSSDRGMSGCATLAEGIEVKDLGMSDGRSTQLVRFAPGAAFA